MTKRLVCVLAVLAALLVPSLARTEQPPYNGWEEILCRVDQLPQKLAYMEDHGVDVRFVVPATIVPQPICYPAPNGGMICVDPVSGFQFSSLVDYVWIVGKYHEASELP